MRIDKFLAHHGFGTRKEVKKLIKDKRVCINDQLVLKEDQKFNELEEIVTVDGEKIEYEPFVYYMLNKPSGVVSATIDEQYATVLECFDCFLPLDVFPVGRLDIDTEGLLLISNDGALAHRLLSPKKHVDKCYEVVCQENITLDMVDLLQHEIVLKDVTYQAGKVIEYHENVMKLVIQEGKFHQVKRMVHAVGNEVVHLKRIAFGPLKLDENLKLGEYRKLTEEELNQLRKGK